MRASHAKFFLPPKYLNVYSLGVSGSFAEVSAKSRTDPVLILMRLSYLFMDLML